jgi:hypothetical protein
MPAYFSISFPGDDDPFDPVVADAAHAIVGTAHCQDRESHASAAEARQKMEAVCQVSGVRRHRIHAREPEAPQRARSDLGEIMHRFYCYTYSIQESLSIHRNSVRPSPECRLKSINSGFQARGHFSMRFSRKIALVMVSRNSTKTTVSTP